MTLVAVSVDSPEQSRRVVDQNRLPFVILADTERHVVRDYGVLHPNGGPTGDIAIPAQVLVAPDGHLLWRHVATRIFDRLSPEQVLERVRDSVAGPDAA